MTHLNLLKQEPNLLMKLKGARKVSAHKNILPPNVLCKLSTCVKSHGNDKLGFGGTGRVYRVYSYQ